MFEPKMWFNRFFLSFKIMGAIKDINIKLWTINISASRQNLDGNLWAIHVRIMHANFQASSFTGVGGESGDIPRRDITPHPYIQNF